MAQRGRAHICCATNAVLNLNSVSLSDAGAYLVTVTNFATGLLGTKSQTATVIVMSDTDRDRIGDEWEIQLGCSPNAASDSVFDDDGDGQTTWQEFMAGTNPRDARSALRFESIRSSAQATDLSFAAQANRGYTVQFRESLDHGRWQTLRQVGSRGVARQETVVDPSFQGNARWHRLATPQMFEPQGSSKNGFRDCRWPDF